MSGAPRPSWCAEGGGLIWNLSLSAVFPYLPPLFVLTTNQWQVMSYCPVSSCQHTKPRELSSDSHYARVAVIVSRAVWGEKLHGGNWDDWNVWQIISVTNSVCVCQISTPSCHSCLVCMFSQRQTLIVAQNLTLKSITCRFPSSLRNE